jgi:hypothetical protein
VTRVEPGEEGRGWTPGELEFTGSGMTWLSLGGERAIAFTESGLYLKEVWPTEAEDALVWRPE